MMAARYLSLILLSLWTRQGIAFISPRMIQMTKWRQETMIDTALGVDLMRDPDEIEIMLGGQRCDMVPLPESMVDTTIFVGNLCEFVRDEDLSNFFQSVSILHSVPSCVARRANMQTLFYGFVTFPTVEEKEVRSVYTFFGATFFSFFSHTQHVVSFFG
jgi:hypothetical protein